jgi:sugar lactone lactonase YvrE
VPLRGTGVVIDPNATWNRYGQTVAGKNPEVIGPEGLFVDDDQTVYVADSWDGRIVAWKEGETKGQVMAGGNGQGNGTHQFYYPTDVIVDKQTDSLIVCDQRNNRVVRWPRRNGTSGETIVANISCRGLSMDEDGLLYIADEEKHEVRRYQRGDSQGTVVAGGNGRGNRLDQLNFPSYIFVDRDYSLFVSEYYNSRVTKWTKGAKEGVVVAGVQGQGNSRPPMSRPCGVVVDPLGTVYVADKDTHQVVRWPKGAQQGTVIIEGGNHAGQPEYFIGYPIGLSFDRHGQLYVVDASNKRVQKFTIEKSSK